MITLTSVLAQFEVKIYNCDRSATVVVIAEVVFSSTSRSSIGYTTGNPTAVVIVGC